MTGLLNERRVYAFAHVLANMSENIERQESSCEKRFSVHEKFAFHREGRNEIVAPRNESVARTIFSKKNRLPCGQPVKKCQNE